MRDRKYHSRFKDRNEEIVRLRFEKGLTHTELAQLFGITRGRIWQLLGNTGRPRTEIEREYCISIVDDNSDKTNDVLIKQFGVSQDHIYKYTHRSKYRHAIKPDSNVYYGTQAEIIVSDKMKELGIGHKLMPYNHPFDILVNDNIRINVKSAWRGNIPPSQVGKVLNNRYHFSLHGRDNTDLFILIIAETKDMFIIPVDILSNKKSDLYMIYPVSGNYGKYQKYINRWDLIYNIPSTDKGFMI